MSKPRIQVSCQSLMSTPDFKALCPSLMPKPYANDALVAGLLEVIFRCCNILVIAVHSSGGSKTGQRRPKCCNDARRQHFSILFAPLFWSHAERENEKKACPFRAPGAVDVNILALFAGVCEDRFALM